MKEIVTSNNDVPTIEKWYFIEYLLKKGGNGCTKVQASDFGDAERKFAKAYANKAFLSAIKFGGIVLTGRYYDATEKFD